MADYQQSSIPQFLRKIVSFLRLPIADGATYISPKATFLYILNATKNFIFCSSIVIEKILVELNQKNIKSIIIRNKGLISDVEGVEREEGEEGVEIIISELLLNPNTDVAVQRRSSTTSLHYR